MGTLAARCSQGKAFAFLSDLLSPQGCLDQVRTGKPNLIPEGLMIHLPGA